MQKMPPRFTPQPFALRVRRSKSGRGLFTNDAIPKGACIAEYTGRPIPKSKQANAHGKYVFETGRGTMIDGNIPSNKARFINHSCAPNCEADGPPGRVFIRAIRRIKPGEELTYDYGKEYFDEHIAPIGCRCTKCSKKAK